MVEVAGKSWHRGCCNQLQREFLLCVRFCKKHGQCSQAGRNDYLYLSQFLSPKNTSCVQRGEAAPPKTADTPTAADIGLESDSAIRRFLVSPATSSLV